MIACSICLIKASETYEGESRCTEHGDVLERARLTRETAWEVATVVPDITFWTTMVIDARKWKRMSAADAYDMLPPIGFSYDLFYRALLNIEWHIWCSKSEELSKKGKP